MVINGKEIAPENNTQYDIYNPATGDVTAAVVAATQAEIETAVEAASTAFLSWSQVSPQRRARVLFSFKQLLENNIEKLAKAITLEHGKTIEDATGEVQRAIECVEFSCGTPYLLKGSYSENVASGIDTYTIRQPLGVCVGIAPFNFPVMISVWMMVPALACGNTFILKPSEKDPSSTLLLAALMKEAGLPDGVFNILQGDQKTVDALITHEKVTAVSSVGSTVAAKHIYQTAIQQGKRAHTFGGAKNHCVVMPDADLNETADAICGAAYGAAGERCMAISVVVAVTDAVADALIAELKTRIKKLKIGSGLQEKMDMGPLVTKIHLEHVRSCVERGVNEGAELIVDGRNYQDKHDPGGFFMGACLFDRVKPSMRIYQDEVFGPVLCIMRADNLDDAIALINQNPYGNGVAIFTNDGGVAKIFASRVTVGMIGVNVAIPVPIAYHTFGGWKQSAFGDIAMHAEENVRFYTREKTVTLRFQKNSGKKNNFQMPTH